MGAGMMGDGGGEKKPLVRKVAVVPPLHAAVKSGKVEEVAALLEVRHVWKLPYSLSTPAIL